MRIVVEGAADVVVQMQRDHDRWREALDGGCAEPELRLFRFDPAGITLGASQRPEHEIDLPRCEREGVRWAVRPTGGRALFHADEWTFALLAPLGPGGWAIDARAAYARTCRWLADSLTRLGVPVVLAPGAARGVGPPRVAASAAPPCFASTARHELLLDGRKFAGVAQRAAAGWVLQQGSLLLGGGHERLADYLAVEDAARAGLRAALLAASATAGGWLGPDRSLTRWAAALVDTADAPVRPPDAAPVHPHSPDSFAPGMLSPRPS